MSNRSDDQGFTILEVLIASALLSVLSLLIVRSWAILDKMSFDLLMRQKAVFVLNGEMERLAALYTTVPGFGSAVSTGNTGYPTLTGITGSTTRTIYPTTGISFATTSIGSTTTPASFLSGDTMVLQYTGSGQAQNFVWLDRGRQLAARLSWVGCPVTGNVAAACWSAAGTAGAVAACYNFSNNAASGKFTGQGPCMMIVLALEYPYQITATGPAALGTQTTMTLSTIVGLRRDQ